MSFPSSGARHRGGVGSSSLIRQEEDAVGSASYDYLQPQHNQSRQPSHLNYRQPIQQTPTAMMPPSAVPLPATTLKPPPKSTTTRSSLIDDDDDDEDDDDANNVAYNSFRSMPGPNPRNGEFGFAGRGGGGPPPPGGDRAMVTPSAAATSSSSPWAMQPPPARNNISNMGGSNNMLGVGVGVGMALPPPPNDPQQQQQQRGIMTTTMTQNDRRPLIQPEQSLKPPPMSYKAAAAAATTMAPPPAPQRQRSISRVSATEKNSATPPSAFSRQGPPSSSKTKSSSPSSSITAAKADFSNSIAMLTAQIDQPDEETLMTQHAHDTLAVIQQATGGSFDMEAIAIDANGGGTDHRHAAGAGGETHTNLPLLCESSHPDRSDRAKFRKQKINDPLEPNPDAVRPRRPQRRQPSADVMMGLANAKGRISMMYQRTQCDGCGFQLASPKGVMLVVCPDCHETHPNHRPKSL